VLRFSELIQWLIQRRQELDISQLIKGHISCPALDTGVRSLNPFTKSRLEELA
jgi:hypothetical protein